MIGLSLREVSLRESIKSKSKEEIEKIKLNLKANFQCNKNEDVENFLYNNSIKFEEEDKAITYFIIDKNWNILAYYTLCFKHVIITDEHTLSKTTIKKMKVSIKDNTVYTILIAQIGKNDCFKENIDLKTILDLAIVTVKKIRKLIGTRILLIEVNDNAKLVELYEKHNFINMGISQNLTQLYALQDNF